MSKRSLIIFFVFLLSTGIQAEGFVFEHVDCKIRFIKSENDYLDKIAREKLKVRAFKVQELVNDKAFFEGDLYYTMDITKDERLYKSCIITSTVKVASDRLPRKKDKVLFKKQIKRSLPRITFSGSERCKMAVKETFIHIPTCKKIGFKD